jgi:hypothetical protein
LQKSVGLNLIYQPKTKINKVDDLSIVSVIGGGLLGKADVGMIHELEEQIFLLVGDSTTKKIMEGSDKITEKTSKKKIAEWVKDAMERLDTFLDEKTRIKIMENCGINCAQVNKRVIEKAKARRKKYINTNEFLEALEKDPMPGTRINREGDTLYHYYTPLSFTRPMRCYCSLLRGLPSNKTVSPTYCHCSKAFVKKYWETILEKPVEVELIHSAVSGAQECKFAVHL